MRIPDKWVILKISGKDPDKDHHRVFGMWSGGYLDGDSWRMNSGIQTVVKDGNYYLFEGYSGSVYKCHKNAYGCTVYGAGVLNSFIDDSNASVSIVPEENLDELFYKMDVDSAPVN